MKFADAQKKMIEYLSSDEFTSREDAETTVSSVPILKRIVRGGFLTDNSQEGLIMNGFNPDSKRYYHIEERAYVTGFLKSEKALALVAWINSYTDKVAFVIDSDPSKAYDTLFFEGDTKLVPSIPVTVEGSSPTKGKITKLEPATTLTTRLPEKVVEFQKKNVHINKAEKVFYVAVFDPKYGRKAAGVGGLYADILKGLAAS